VSTVVEEIQRLEDELGTWLAAYRRYSDEYVRTQRALKTATTWHQAKHLRQLSQIAGDCQYARDEVMRVSSALTALKLGRVA
jgi:hypothetical protein